MKHDARPNTLLRAYVESKAFYAVWRRALVCCLNDDIHGLIAACCKRTDHCGFAGSRHPRLVRFSGPAYPEGIEVYTIDGVPVKIYEAAKTVADCFKYRNKIGLDLCLEALSNGLRRRKFSVDQLSHFAKICRVHNIIQPYIKAML